MSGLGMRDVLRFLRWDNRENATMATPPNVPHVGPHAVADDAPVVRTLTTADLGTALRKGLDDFKAVPSHAVILALIYPVLGIVIARLALGYSAMPLLFPLAAGFALIGPFAAIGLYEMSRRRELGEEPSAWQAFEVLRSPSFGAMLGLGVLLLALFVTLDRHCTGDLRNDVR